MPTFDSVESIHQVRQQRDFVAGESSLVVEGAKARRSCGKPSFPSQSRQALTLLTQSIAMWRRGPRSGIDSGKFIGVVKFIWFFLAKYESWYWSWS